LIEGGGVLAARALAGGLVDRLALFIAPKLLGGDGRPMVGAMGLGRMSEAVPVVDVALERLGEDLLIEGSPGLPKKAMKR
jgi:diaminohydroxyphosphoribosylaminopyrimidine deaminase/5-amino-6-(5-phosphoribosylamino)uracil reductase